MCLYNTLILNPKYKQNQKNGGKVPPMKDTRVKYIPAGCGNCKECRKQKAREWQVRLLEEIKEQTDRSFVTLTFSNESIKHIIEQEIEQVEDHEMQINENGKLKWKPIKKKVIIKTLTGYKKDNAIATWAVRHFLKRWEKEHKKTLKHWFITELGHRGTENIHLHGIVWTKDLDKVERIWGTGKPYKDITGETRCQGGWIFKGTIKNGKHTNYVTGQTVNYMTKYVTKVDFKHKEYKSIILTSPGIGANYIKSHNAQKNKFNGKNTKEIYKTSTGHEMKLPIYWRNKLYTEEQREQLWLYKLDKEERWVCGEKVDIKTIEGVKEYTNLVQYYRRKNTELGYGGLVNENRKAYEEHHRELMLETRIQNTKRNRATPA